MQEPTLPLLPIHNSLFNTLQLAFGLVGSHFDPSSETSLCRGESKVTQILHGHVPTYTTGSINTGLFISPSGISEIDCATTKTDTAERSISIGRESRQVFFVLGALAFDTFRGYFFRVPPCPHYAPSMPPCSLVLGPSTDTPTPLCEP